MNDIPINNTVSAFSGAVADINNLVDIRSVTIDPSLPVPEKKKLYLQQIKTPELFRCGDTIVRISHVSTGVTLADRMKQYLLSKQGLSLM